MKKINNMDELLPISALLLYEEDLISTTHIQRRLGIGYPRAARIIDQMSDMGIISEYRPYKFLVTQGEIEEEFADYLKELKISTPHQYSSYMKNFEKGIDKNVNVLNAENLNFFDENNVELSVQDIESLKTILRNSIVGEDFVIKCDYNDLKKFITKNDYKIKVLTLPFDFESVKKYLENFKHLATICIISISIGTDFPSVIDFANRLQASLKNANLLLRVVENENDVGIKILY